MITAGLDVGIENIKVIILQDGKVLARSSNRSGGANRSSSADQAWNTALKSAAISATDVDKVIATGQGKKDVRFAKTNITEPVADAAAARFLFPSAQSVVDLGADQIRVTTLGPQTTIREAVLNQKCSAGIGIFLEAMARMLGLTIDEMSRMPNGASAPVAVSDNCCVFGELDAVALIHDNVPKQQIVSAINQAMAVRINSVLNDKIVPDKKHTALLGGVAKNAGIVNILKKRSGIDFLIPEHAEFGGALGAALIAAS